MPTRRHGLAKLNSKSYSSNDFCMPGAASLMPLKTPPLRVSRPVAACQRCRTAKIRCDGKLPACTACERSGRAQQCSSTNSQFAPGKERSYVATLEASAERLEKRIQDARRRRQSSLSMLDVLSPLSPASRSDTWSSSETPKDQKAKARKELHTIDELVSDFGFLTIHANARDYSYGFTNSISYARLILASATKEELPSGMKKALPSRSETLPLVNLYVDNCLTLHPLFLEAEIFGSIERIYQTGLNAATALDHWTIRMILAVISAMQSNQRGDMLYADAVGHICEALVIADQVLHPGSIKSIQAMLLLVQYSLLDPAHFDSWTLIGAASRAMIDLGLHQDPSKSSNTPRAKLELRRRIFYCVYGLDRVTSIVQTRAFSFSDDSTSVGLPFTMKKPSSPTSPTATSPGGNMWVRSNEITLRYVELRKLQSLWYQELFQSGREPWTDPYIRIWAIYRSLSEWFAGIPAATPTAIKNFLEIDLLYSYIYILSPNPRCPQPSEHAQRLLLQHAALYAKTLLAVLSEPGRVNRLSPFTFYDALRVYMVARWYIETLRSNMDSLLMPPRHTSSLSAQSSTTIDDIDPLAAVGPPPLLDPSGSSNGEKPCSAQAAISTIESFLNILSSFEMRFGRVSGVSWRDKIQQDSQLLVSQLQQRIESENSSVLSDPVGYFWRKPGPISRSVTGDMTSPATQHTSVVSTQLGTSPGRGSQAGAYYPSPAATQYSPGAYAGQDVDASSGSTILSGGVGQIPLWTTSGASTDGSSGVMNLNAMRTLPPMMVPQQQNPQNIVMPQYPNTAAFTGGEFGIGNMAAWETLPGGNLNARFS